MAPRRLKRFQPGGHPFVPTKLRVLSCVNRKSVAFPVTCEGRCGSGMQKALRGCCVGAPLDGVVWEGVSAPVSVRRPPLKEKGVCADLLFRMMG